MLRINPDHICVDGSQLKNKRRLLDQYRKQIMELIDHGFQPIQILRKLKEQYPDVPIKRTTLNDYCIELRSELYDYIVPPLEDSSSLLSHHLDKIRQMLEDRKTVATIFSAIQTDGYSGAYWLLRQYCQSIKPKVRWVKKALRKVKRRDLISVIWSGNSSLTEQDLAYIESQNPTFAEIKSIIVEFREAYSNKDIDSVTAWCAKYEQCRFPAIRSFIKGIYSDSDAFYNSIKYEYNNGLLEGTVNKLKAVKRYMFGRASYLLLRAKLLLAQKFR